MKTIRNIIIGIVSTILIIVWSAWNVFAFFGVILLVWAVIKLLIYLSIKLYENHLKLEESDLIDVSELLEVKK